MHGLPCADAPVVEFAKDLPATRRGEVSGETPSADGPYRQKASGCRVSSSGDSLSGIYYVILCSEGVEEDRCLL